MFGEIIVKVQLRTPKIINDNVIRYDEFRCDSLFDAVKFVCGVPVYDSLFDCMQDLDFSKYCPMSIDDEMLLAYRVTPNKNNWDLYEIWSENYYISYNKNTDKVHIENR